MKDHPLFSRKDQKMSSLPFVSTIDLSNRSSASRPQQVAEIGKGLSHCGFVNLIGHGVSMDLLEDAYKMAERLFALPSDVKLKYESLETGRQRGYTPYLVEKAKDQQVGDLKEFWHIGRNLSADHPFRNVMKDNLLPTEMPELKEVMDKLYMEMDQLAFYVVGLIADYLGLDRNVFDDMVKNGNSILRVIHYPDVNNAPEGSVRSAAHEDINLLTLLPAATKPGLEILTKDGEWVDVAPPVGAIVCDTGDMMQLLTNGKLPATTHRVINPKGGRDGGRYSMPFFMHPHPQAILNPFFGSQASISAHAFLHERLVANGVALS
jgi:isopenicillin N synthase-like dioxygenase